MTTKAKTLYLGIDIEEYIDGYEFRADEGDYTPNEQERMLITDAIYGIIDEIDRAINKQRNITTGVLLIQEERRRQIEVKNFNAEHDDQYKDDELLKAAACYALNDNLFIPAPENLGPNINKIGYDNIGIFPWPDWLDKFRNTPRLKQLTIAGALIAAEIDRILRKGGE